MAIVLLVILIALIFEFINGFHDTANSIATVVSTKVLSPRQAILLAGITNFLGALWGTAVAKTIASGVVNADIVTSHVIIAALAGGIVWNLLTWKFGLPSSSSHALIGGLCGAALHAANNSWDVIIWSQPSAAHWWEGKGVLWKIIIPMMTSPICGFLIALFFMAFLYLVLQKVRPRIINRTFGTLQVFSAASMGFMHGTNDAQKTMGIIALCLFTATGSGVLNDIPEWASFLKIQETSIHGLDIPIWIKGLCAIVMACGTMAGGWRIIRTLGHKMVKLQPIHGFAAETSSSIVLFAASHYGIPVSTTHNITSAVMGVGAAKRLSSINWLVVERILWAWVLTLPCSGLIAYVVMSFL